jgi:hypothetical protein
VGKLDITGGDKQKIGYYAGFIVEFISFVPCKMSRAILTWTCRRFGVVGIFIFLDRGYRRLPMESNIRSYWEKAGTLVWDGRNDYIHGILWVVSYILYPCD